MAIIPIRRDDTAVRAARLPAEWEPQSGVMLTWPHAFGDWAPCLADADHTFALIGAAISRHEQLLIAAYDHHHKAHIAEQLRGAAADLTRVRIETIPSDDVFVRDHGPIAVESSQGLVLLDFRFNGWGGKYAHSHDNDVSAGWRDHGAFGVTAFETMDLVLEGGSIESDGQGTLLLTASCLLSPSRNPKLTRPELEQTLKRTLGCDRLLWLQHGYLAGDDTDGHIDTLARFCDPDTIVYCACPSPDDEHYQELKAMEAELQSLVTRDGRPYRLIPLPWPSAKLDAKGERMPATYANFLILNGAVLVPTYDDRRDPEALATLARCFPDREIVGIPCLALIAQHGSLHCATMQLPRGVLP